MINVGDSDSTTSEHKKAPHTVYKIVQLVRHVSAPL